jgi:hypothetical protein
MCLIDIIRGKATAPTEAKLATEAASNLLNLNTIPTVPNHLKNDDDTIATATPATSATQKSSIITGRCEQLK